MSCQDVPLDRGGHADAGAGRCLMEHVSTLAGEPFGPLPRCTHPVLAALAVGVNDRVGDRARAELADRAPALRHAHGRDPALAWRFVEHAARAVLARRPGDPGAARRLRRAGRAVRVWDRLLPPRRCRALPGWVLVGAALAALDELTVAFHALLAAHPAAGPDGSAERDRALVELLDAAIATTLASTAPGPVAQEVAR